MDLATPLLAYGPLGIAVVALSLVVVKQDSRIQKLEAEKVAILESWRQETQDNGKDALEVIKGNSQAQLYLANKIESGKK